MHFLIVQVGVFCWGLFSIKEIGHYIEAPFAEDTAQLPLARICANIGNDVTRLLERRPETGGGSSLIATPLHQIEAARERRERVPDHGRDTVVMPDHGRDTLVMANATLVDHKGP
jgi:hypothetical protein